MMADGSTQGPRFSCAPGPESTRDFRDALGRFATGVTVVTTASDIGPLGITANSFASVSLDPALVLWSPAKGSRRYEAFAHAAHYAIHVLAADQAALCKAFTGDGMSPFETIDWAPSALGVPLIAGCLARFECAHEATHDAGDHAIVLGRVTQADWGAGAPLVFSQGVLGSFEALGPS